jgi:hypothetical protein
MYLAVIFIMSEIGVGLVIVALKRRSRQKRVAILLVRPRNVQHPNLPDDRRAQTDLTKLISLSNLHVS